jgi:hypothetical protein
VVARGGIDVDPLAFVFVSGGAFNLISLSVLPLIRPLYNLPTALGLRFGFVAVEADRRLGK